MTEGMRRAISDGRSLRDKKSSESSRGAPNRANPAETETGVKGVNYPANKNELIKKANDNKAPSDVLSVLNHLKNNHYSSPIEIAKEVGRVER